MGCNCEPKKYSISMGCCQPVLGPIENYYTKYQIDEMLEEIESAITSGCCITPEEVDEKIDEAVSGKQDTLIAGDNIIISGNVISASGCECDLSDYYTKEQVDAKIPSLSGYATEQWVENKGYINQIKTINGQSLIGTGDIEIGTGGTIDLSNYYTTAETNTRISQEVSGKANTSDVVTNVTVTDGTGASSGTVFVGFTKNGITTNSGIYTVGNGLIKGVGRELSVDTNLVALKSDIPTIPTSNTAFTNDAGYLTEHQSLTAYSTTQEVTNLINQSVSGKQDTLSAGTNITIVDNVISATGGGSTYTPSSGINITNNEISTKIGSGLRYTQDGTLEVNSTNAIASGNTQVPLSYVVYNYVNNNCMMKSQIWCGTQAQYDAITTKDNNVIYLIHE